ncbi:MAG: (Fe-S)-binding protein [Acidobacteria bacterium]|nr:(Fe-S)-binding protein [Acidobacteriota bacterium]
MNASVQKALKDSRSFLCLECGRCTAVCPVSGVKQDFSPRRVLSNLLTLNNSDPLNSTSVWECLTCGYCSLVCPTRVDYTGLMRAVRMEAEKPALEELCSHGGVMQTIMQIMVSGNLDQKRMGWIPEEAKYSKTKGEVIYFTGCLPYFDAFFSYIDVDTLQTGRQTLRLLNALGVKPVVLPNERCCGHDLLWSGDLDGFRRLNEINLELFAGTGARILVTSCAECYHIFKYEVPELVGDHGLEVLHISQFLYRHKSSLQSKLRPGEKLRLTYQDPCRLGRQGGVYDEPRDVLTLLPGVELAEMPRHGPQALCCGTSAWMNCTSYSKQIQAERLAEAAGTGAGVLVTACPKCYIHFTCAQHDQPSSSEKQVTVRDMTDVIASSLEERR